MNKYPNEAQPEANHRPKHVGGQVVGILVVIAVGVFGVSAYLHRPTTGTVTTVSATSITIRPSGSSVTRTFSITKTTQMVLAQSANSSLRPQSFNARDIHTGEMVVVSGSSNNQAQAIVVKSQ
jgi:hypothetical protein